MTPSAGAPTALDGPPPEEGMNAPRGRKAGAPRGDVGDHGVELAVEPAKELKHPACLRHGLAKVKDFSLLQYFITIKSPWMSVW